ncbi:MAG: hypothetical protein H6617_02350 [Bdellovibrionaceae bacterium]|nr:hypothetical protein [Bdellovibrionales bacterium]MCB9253503.1 hypothetical protein [Pseudobdellovibrionaceae bacterium]
MFEPLKRWWQQRKSARRTRNGSEGSEPFLDPRIEGDFEDDRSLFQRFRESLQGFAARRRRMEPLEDVPPKAKKRRKLPKIDLKKVELSRVSEHAKLIRWGLVVVALYLASEIVSRVVSVWVRPSFVEIPRRMNPTVTETRPRKGYGDITDRNMFNVEGTIPDPFDQGMLDCFSQAKRSTQPLTLLGTIVMKSEEYSVALVQEGGNPESVAVKKDETFFNKYVALKVERQRFCFQVKATQDLEYIEVKDDTPGMDLGSPTLNSGSAGINASSETEFSISKSFLDSKINDLNNILQSARAVPYVDSQGVFKGFLIQSIQQDSIFFELGIRQGDILNGVNDIKLDNPGKGLQAFQQLRNSSQVALEITRGGQSKTLNYQVK